MDSEDVEELDFFFDFLLLRNTCFLVCFPSLPIECQKRTLRVRNDKIQYWLDPSSHAANNHSNRHECKHADCDVDLNSLVSLSLSLSLSSLLSLTLSLSFFSNVSFCFCLVLRRYFSISLFLFYISYMPLIILII